MLASTESWPLEEFAQIASDGQLASDEAKLGARAERGAVRGGVDERRERLRSRASESG